MTITLAYLSTAVSLLLIGLLFWFGLWLNRRLRLNLRSLRWAAVYFCLSFILGFMTPFILQLNLDAGDLPFGWTSGTFIARWKIVTGILRGISHLTLVGMIFSELAPLLARNSPVVELQDSDPLSKLRERMTILGCVLITSVLIPIGMAATMLGLS